MSNDFQKFSGGNTPGSLSKGEVRALLGSASMPAIGKGSEDPKRLKTAELVRMRRAAK